MTGKERYMNMLDGKPIDTMPVSPFIHTNWINEFFDVDADKAEGFDLLAKCIELNEYFGFDILFRSAHLEIEEDIATEVSSDDGKWVVNNEEIKKGDTISQITTIITPERKLRQVKETKRNTKYYYVSAISEYYIKEKDDFEQFVKYQPPMKKVRTRDIVRALEITGDKGIVLGHTYGAFNYLNFFRKLEDMLMDPILDEVMYREMISYFSARIKSVINQMMDAGILVMNLAMNLASGTLVGSKFFKKYILEYENDILNMIRDKGGYNMIHNCGDARNLFEVYNDMPIDIYESMTHPPYGDTILEEALKIFRKDLILCGNIDQVDFLKNATPEEVENVVKDVVLKSKERGNFILSTSDFISNDTPYENIKAFVKAGREYGKY